MSRTLGHLRRYLSLVDDPRAFMASASAPLPRVIWVNPLVMDPEAGNRRIRDIFEALEPSSWRPYTWRLPPDARIAPSFPYLSGLYHAQEEAALWAGDLVGAEPGERILDLCAAPGGKSAQIAVQLENRGTLVANDRNGPRIAALRRTLERLGVHCAVVTHRDGIRFPLSVEPFDRVLVDAPCTGEGTSRKRGGHRGEHGACFREAVVQIQKALLRRAIKLVKPGGIVVYSTCTYAPEENEAVVDAVDRRVAEIMPTGAPQGLQVSPGLTQWQGMAFGQDLRHTLRIWPHHNDTGGFYAARLRRL